MLKYKTSWRIPHFGVMTKKLITVQVFQFPYILKHKKDSEVISSKSSQKPSSSQG